MPGIDTEVIECILYIGLTAKKVREKQRSFRLRKYAIIVEEVEHLLDVGFMRESHYLEWLSNVVLLKMINGERQMCGDFTYLNKACLNPLLRVDLTVD